jgi:hypothetical protein
MLPPDVLQWLRCPIDPQRQATLIDEETHLTCSRCRVRFPVCPGYIDLLPGDAELPQQYGNRGHLPCRQGVEGAAGTGEGSHGAS